MRLAFTLIELIFAIVIIAITVVSLPMMNQAVSKGIDANIVQEAIFAASTELNEVVTAHWDENSTEPSAPNSYARVIDFGNCDNNTSSPRYRLLPGHVDQELHRKCLENNSTRPSNTDIASVTSLSDMAHGAEDIFISTTLDHTGYKKLYKSKVEITRPANFNGLNDSIKEIKVTIIEDSKDIVILKTYSSNIGEVDYYKRTY